MTASNTLEGHENIEYTREREREREREVTASNTLERDMTTLNILERGRETWQHSLNILERET